MGHSFQFQTMEQTNLGQIPKVLPRGLQPPKLSKLTGGGSTVREDVPEEVMLELGPDDKQRLPSSRKNRGEQSPVTCNGRKGLARAG